MKTIHAIAQLELVRAVHDSHARCATRRTLALAQVSSPKARLTKRRGTMLTDN
jgi:hypothetical protein